LVALRHPSQAELVRALLPEAIIVLGESGLDMVASYPHADIIVNALSGSAGLMPSVASLQHHKRLALANKESLVMAGDELMRLSKANNVPIIPIDSEHHAIQRLLQGQDIDAIDHITITASGGAFRDHSRDALEHVTIQEALKHPTWSMGPKITIDSATMMNKVLEVIEAHHLFGLPSDMIDTVLHEESLVHGLVFYKDGSAEALMGAADMRTTIKAALTYPTIDHIRQPQFALTDMHFRPMDLKRYPLMTLASLAVNQKGLLPVVINAANEAAVTLFLEGHIPFLMIETIIFDAVRTCPDVKNPTLDVILDTDRKIKKHIIDIYRKR
jgi:1-deoxy-D-xylulose-5-phosphate reductoisomerase